jgi:hypothetical protein
MKHFLAYSLVHDIEPYPEFWIPEKAIFRSTQVYDAEDWLSRDYANSQFYPYWDKSLKAPVLLHTDAVSGKEVLLSSRRDGKRVMTSIVNDTDREICVTLTFQDFDPVMAFNTFNKNSERYSIRENKLELKFGPREGKILCLSED